MIETNLKYTNDAVKYNSYDSNIANNEILITLSFGKEEYKRYIKELNLNYDDVKDTIAWRYTAELQKRLNDYPIITL